MEFFWGEFRLSLKKGRDIVQELMGCKRRFTADLNPPLNANQFATLQSSRREKCEKFHDRRHLAEERMRVSSLRVSIRVILTTSLETRRTFFLCS